MTLDSSVPIDVIVLAAGLGTRMKSRQPKVLHQIAGRSLLDHVLAGAAGVFPRQNVVVIGPEFPENLRQSLAKQGIKTALQAERLGSGHAALQAEKILADEMASNPGASKPGLALILAGDAPLITSTSLGSMVRLMQDDPACALVIAAFHTDNPTGYGRLIPHPTKNSEIIKIVEERDASPDERKITLCNAGIYAVREDVLFSLLKKVTNHNAQKEYYFTDIIGLAREAGLKINFHLMPQSEAVGINSRSELATAEAMMQHRLRQAVMAGGVTLRDPDSVYLCYDTMIGRDTVIEPNVVFGPGVSIGENVSIRAFCHLEGVTIGDHAVIGPFARLRPDTTIGVGAHVGNFVELKKTSLGAGAKANHLSYLGDATIGAAANIGAGTITCNYDGFDKFPTVIGAGAFIGSNSALLAPTEIGAGAMIAAGSVLGGFIPADAMALTRVAPEIRPKAAERFRQKHNAKGKA